MNYFDDYIANKNNMKKSKPMFMNQLPLFLQRIL